MKLDYGITKENNWFRYRTGGIITHNGKLLFVKSKYGGYFYMIGGGVHIGEPSVDCHTIEFYYRMSITDEQQKLCREQTDEGEQLVWIDISEVEKSIIKPTCMSERILEILNNKNIIHIIEERDR